MKTLNLMLGSLMLSILLVSCEKNEYAPEIADQEFSVEENSPAGTVIDTVEAFDGDEGQDIIFEIVDGNEDGTFALDPNCGCLRVADSALLDFESLQLYSLTVMASDDHKKESQASYATITIHVTDVYEVPSGQIAYYPFDGNANDLTGNDHNGTIYGAVLTDDRDGNASRAYYFNGNLAYIDLGNASELKRYKSDYTVCGWINLASFSSTYNSIILSNRNHQTPSVSGSFMGVGGLQASLSKRVEFVQNATVTSDEFTFDYLSSDTQLELDTWYFFAISYEYKGNLENTLKIYINGNFESQKLVGEVIDPEDAPSYLGCEPALSPIEYSFHGSMDELEIYARALSETEIQSIYNK